MSGAPDPRAELVDMIPRLRAFAISLCGKREEADDLVQETLVKAWSHIESFQPGTNMIAWLFTILRNEFYSSRRKRRREVPDVDGELAALAAVPPTQEGHMAFQDFRDALFKLSDDYREALILVGASGLSYEEAAQICGCAVGTVKSRVHRAREQLGLLLSGNAARSAA
jgi:RNA polymerase sigma-70 factor (ECF subfamily)